MHSRHVALALALALLVAPAAEAHHAGGDVDAVMSAREPSFVAVDAPAPYFELADAQGETVRLDDFAEAIVVLKFVKVGCEPCREQAALFAEAQAMIGASPMGDRVRFLTVTTSPEENAGDALARHVAESGLDPATWDFLTMVDGDPPHAARLLAQAYGVDPDEEGKAVTLVIDRGLRLAGRFEGAAFDPVNLVLYVNGLLQHAPASLERGGDGGRWWERLRR
jgi:protein SCO1